MVNGIVIAVLVILVFFAIRSIVKAKANGQHCCGCPCSGSCQKKSCDRE